MRLLTFSGRSVAPMAPRTADIGIEDIAHALAHQCRFGGHVREFYSVAQHSIYVSRHVPPEAALWALLHDASEAYIADVPTPLKRLPVMDPYRAVEAQMQRCCFHAFGLTGDVPEAVADADQALLILEAEALFFPVPAWTQQLRQQRGPLPAVDIRPVAPLVAKRAFLQRFAALTEGRA